MAEDVNLDDVKAARLLVQHGADIIIVEMDQDLARVIFGMATTEEAGAKVFRLRNKELPEIKR